MHSEHDLSDASSRTSILEAIPNPPIPGDPAPSVRELFARVNSFAKSNGFGVIKANGVIRPGQRSRYVFQCDRYGTQRPTRGAGLRKRKSRKAGCKWKITAESLPENSFQWTLRHFANEAHHRHNHRASADAAAHPSHRRLTSPVKAVVQLSSRQVGIRARDVGGIVRSHFPESVFTRRDIYNARAQIHRGQLGGYSSTAALIKLFDEQAVPYVAKWADDEPDRLVGLVWTFPYCVKMWRRFSEVISFDNTYNTNRFKLPLFQVTGQTCLGSVFNAAFGLIDNERLEGFRFLASSVRVLLDEHDIRPPDVIITDFDKQMKRALEEAFADAQQQLCIHHINSNVLLQGKRRWVYKSTNSSTGEESSSEEHNATLNPRDCQAVQASERPDEPTQQGERSQVITHDYHGVLVAWKQVVFAETEKEHEKSWEFLCKQFADQQAILAYLYATYMPVRHQWARCFIKKHRNFGVRVTSGTEASNNNVKSYLLNGMSHLYRLVDAIRGMLEDQERDFRQACAQDEVLTSQEHVGRGSEYLGELPQTVSQKALGLISREYRKALKNMPSPINPWPDSVGACNDDCTVSIELGIPCHHTIHRKLISASHLAKWDVHPRWHLRESVSRDIYRRILDPKIANSLRGRPRNNPQPLPARMGVQVCSQVQHLQSSTSQPLNDPDLCQVVLQRNRNVGALANSTSQRRSLHLGAGKTTGVRSSGRRIKPSVRRQRSQWELAVDVAISPSDQSSKASVNSRQPAQRRCSKCHATGHYRNSRACRLWSTGPVAASAAALSTSEPGATTTINEPLRLAEATVINKISIEATPLVPPIPNMAVTGLSANRAARRGDPRTIYRNYVEARAAWYETLPRGSIKTNQEYRRSLGLPLRYDRRCYEWYLSDGGMTPLGTTLKGTRAWTKEEMMAYLDWSQTLEGFIEESVAVEGRMGKTSGRSARNEHDASCELAQPDEEEASTLVEEGCIVVKP